MSSKRSHDIKARKEAKDVFITPPDLAKLHIDFVIENFVEGEFNNVDIKDLVWLAPCRYNQDGSYWKHFKETYDFQNADWCEITEGRNFFEYNLNPQIICGNPPYSIFEDWIKKTIDTEPYIFSYLIEQGKLTPRRLEIIEDAGYYLAGMKMLKVRSWYGISYICVFKQINNLNNGDSAISFNRKVWG